MTIEQLLLSTEFIVATVLFGIGLLLILFYVVSDKKNMGLIILSVLSILMSITLLYAKCQQCETREIYDRALEYEKNDDYISAYITYSSIIPFDDVNTRLMEIYVPYTYQSAMILEEEGKWEKALIMFIDVKDRDTENSYDTSKHIQYCLDKYIEEEGWNK